MSDGGVTGDVGTRQSTGDVALQTESGVCDILLHELKGSGALLQCLELQVLLMRHSQGSVLRNALLVMEAAFLESYLRQCCPSSGYAERRW